MEIKLNQGVVVIGIGNNARYSTPVHNAKVSKIGRKWFYVECESEYYIGRDYKFSLESGICDGKGYNSEWQVFESLDIKNKLDEIPKLRREIIEKIGKLNHEELIKILKQI